MRPIKELLEIVLKEIYEQKYRSRDGYNGICDITENLCDAKVITSKEEDYIDTYIDKYIYDNRPDKVKQIYYWPKGDMIVRIEWLTKQIEKL